jgi:hypothetical protein
MVVSDEDSNSHMPVSLLFLAMRFLRLCDAVQASLDNGSPTGT